MHKNRIPVIVIKCVCFDNLYFHLEQLALAQDVIIVKLNESWTWHIDEVRFINQPVFLQWAENGYNFLPVERERFRWA